MTEDGGHAVAPSEQRDGGLEQLCPGQAAVAAVGLGVATELPGYPDPLGPCMCGGIMPLPPLAPSSALWPAPSRPHVAPSLAVSFLEPSPTTPIPAQNPCGFPPPSTPSSRPSPWDPHKNWLQEPPPPAPSQWPLPRLLPLPGSPLFTQGAPLPGKLPQQVRTSKGAVHPLAAFPWHWVSPPVHEAHCPPRRVFWSAPVAWRGGSGASPRASPVPSGWACSHWSSRPGT